MSRANPRFRRTNPSLNPVGLTNGVVQYVIEGRLENQMTLSTFMFVAANPNPTQAQLSTLSTAISSGVFPKYAALISADWTCFRELLKCVHRNDIATNISTGRAQSPGTRPAGHEPTEVAGLFLRQTPTKGQHGRGRVSIPGVYTGDVTNSNWTGVTISLNQTAFNNSLVGVNFSDGTNNWLYCVGQRGSATPRLITNYAVISSQTASLLLGTVRRRKVGRGK